jgi:hypothetical protein
VAGRTTYVRDPETGKFVEKSAFIAANQSAAVHTMEPFISPIDGSLIRDPAQLRSHNAQHGVTDSREYGDNWFEKKSRERDLRLTGQDKASKRDRIEAFKRATEHVRT